jgi:hypothetical protein
LVNGKKLYLHQSCVNHPVMLTLAGTSSLQDKHEDLPLVAAERNIPPEIGLQLTRVPASTRTQKHNLLGKLDMYKQSNLSSGLQN